MHLFDAAVFSFFSYYSILFSHQLQEDKLPITRDRFCNIFRCAEPHPASKSACKLFRCGDDDTEPESSNETDVKNEEPEIEVDCSRPCDRVNRLPFISTSLKEKLCAQIKKKCAGNHEMAGKKQKSRPKEGSKAAIAKANAAMKHFKAELFNERKHANPPANGGPGNGVGRVCCQAMTLSCMACNAGLDPKELCDELQCDQGNNDVRCRYVCKSFYFF